jgi:predicted amidophosphoribosyltransferase
MKPKCPACKKRFRPTPPFITCESCRHPCTSNYGGCTHYEEKPRGRAVSMAELLRPDFREMEKLKKKRLRLRRLATQQAE